MTGLVELRNIAAGYGALEVLHRVSIGLPRGTITVLLGHNGAGKSTLAKAIAGLVRVTGGTILMDGEDITRLSTAERLRRGVSLVLQENAVFAELSVQDNLRVAGGSMAGGRAQLDRSCRGVFEIFPVLEEFRARPATSLSGGQQRMLAIGMGIMTRPKVLILDEPSLGLSPRLVGEVMQQISAICHGMKMTILLIEQNIEAALAICDEVVAIRNGEVIFSGLRSDLQGPHQTVALL